MSACEACYTTLRVELVRQGKVREGYADGDDVILVASDRVSVYDVVLPTPIPDKLLWVSQDSNETGPETTSSLADPARIGCVGVWPGQGGGGGI